MTKLAHVNLKFWKFSDWDIHIAVDLMFEERDNKYYIFQSIVNNDNLEHNVLNYVSLNEVAEKFSYYFDEFIGKIQNFLELENKEISTDIFSKEKIDVINDLEDIDFNGIFYAEARFNNQSITDLFFENTIKTLLTNIWIDKVKEYFPEHPINESQKELF